jgi:hypothetical protein
LGLLALSGGVPAEKAGQAFRCNLFIGEKPLKSIFTTILNANRTCLPVGRLTIEKNQ